MNKGEVIPEAAVRFVRTLPAPVSKVWRKYDGVYDKRYA